MKKITQTQRAIELGTRIDAYLKRFEADPKINGITSKFYRAAAWSDRHRVIVRYATFQGTHHLSITEAAAYVARLDEGDVVKHFQVRAS